MMTLIITILILILCYVLSDLNPFVAGLIAVIPIKIIGVGLMSFETGARVALMSSISGMLIGQFIIGFILLGLYVYLK